MRLHSTRPRPSAGWRARLVKGIALAGALVTAAAGLAVLSPAGPASALSGETRMHDTSAIRVGDCTWIYSTGFENDPDNPTGAITMHRSCDADQVTGWTDMGPIWDAVPAWITARYNGVTPPNYWAPDINYFNGKYYLYYAASLWQNNKVASTGLATADSPGGPWTDQGEVTNVNYPIDGNIAWTTGADSSPYIAWGSWAGTYLHLVDPTTGKLSTTDDNLWKISTGIENPAILPHDGYYYLLGSRGSCCSGVNSTYYTVVGRSTSITGPYLDKSGKDMLNGGGSTILTGFGTQVAAGGGDWYEADGALYFAYHYYDATNSGRETGNIRPITFADGWPVLGTPVGSIQNITAPTLSGRPHVGVPLVADPGTWNNADAVISYQWLRDGAAIADATDAQYAPVADDLGHAVSVTVTASKTGYDSASATTSAKTIVEQPALPDGLAQAASADLTPYTKGSAESFQREVKAITAAAAEPGADVQALSDRLEDAWALLVSTDTLLVKQPIARPWVTASTPIFGNAGSAADNGWALFDGDPATFVSGNTANGTVTVTPTDDSTITIDRLRVYPRGENLESRLIGHKFQGSNDGGATWETFATLTSAQAGQWTTVDLPTTKTYQRIRMVDDHGGWINAGEAEILARSTDSTLVELLLGDADAIDRGAYEADSLAALDTAVTAAKALNGASQTQIDAAADALRTALNALTPSSVPDKPAAPTAAVSGTSIAVSWEAGSGTAITGYAVTLEQDGGEPQVKTVDALTHAVSFDGLPIGVYRASLVATNAAGSSAESDASAPVTVAPVAGSTGTLAPEKHSVEAGARLKVSGSGFAPGESVTLTLHSAPVLLGTVAASSSGDVTFDVVVPASTEAGDHSLVAVGASSAVTASAGLTVTSATAAGDPGAGGSAPASTGTSGNLASTGATVLPFGMLSALLLLAGVAVLVARRKSAPTK